VALAIVEFSDDTLFPTQETVRVLTDNDGSQRIGSSVLSASLGVPVSNLPDKDKICGTYEYLVNLVRDPTWRGSVNKYDSRADPSYATPKCVFYNHTSRVWARDGCEMTFSNGSHATCCCNHLTSFAVLVGGESVATDDEVALMYITWIGLGTSLLCLALTVLCVLGAQALRSTLRYKILLNMVVALAVSNFLFFFITVPESVSECKAVSMLLMYFLLSFFAWMNVEAWYLYETFVNTDVFDVHEHGAYAKLKRCVVVMMLLLLLQ